MRLLHLIHSLDPRGGGPPRALRAFLDFAPAEQTVATMDSPGAEWLTSWPENVAALGPARLNYGFTPRLAPWLRANAASFDAAIIHGLWQFHSAGALPGLRAAGIPHFVRPCGMLDPWFKHAHPLKHLKKHLYWPVERRVLCQARALLFTAQEEGLRAAQSFGPIGTPAEIVPLGIEDPVAGLEPARAEFLARFPETEGKTLILFLGRLHPKKGPDLLIRAFAELLRAHPEIAERTRLVLAGPAVGGRYLNQLQSLATQECPGGSILFPGMLSGPAKWGALASADCFVLPSHQENFGLSIAEALAAGTPVLISDQINIWREIDGAQGGFVAPDNQAGTCALLERWFALAPRARLAMKAAARRCYKDNFTAEASGRALAAALSRRGIANTTDALALH